MELDHFSYGNVSRETTDIPSMDFLDHVCVVTVFPSRIVSSIPDLEFDLKVILALVHTIPFIISDIKTGTMVEQWKEDVFIWTGVAALVPQAWLCFMSLRPIR
jgi:hypothetical protein